jgi:hypothetical protein
MRNTHFATVTGHCRRLKPVGKLLGLRSKSPLVVVPLVGYRFDCVTVADAYHERSTQPTVSKIDGKANRVNFQTKLPGL